MNHARKSFVTKSLFIVQSVLLVSGIVIVGVLSYSAFMNQQAEFDNVRKDLAGLEQNSTIQQSLVDNLNSTANALEYNYSKLESNFTNLYSNFTGLYENYSELARNFTGLYENYNELESNFMTLYENYNATLPPVTDSSYYIFKQNDTYYAKSGFTGNIENSSSNCSAVLEYALMHVPAYGTVFLKSLATDNDSYYIDSTIYMPSHTTLASENKMVTLSLMDNCNVDVIQLYNVFDTQIRNLRIYGNKENNKSGNGIDINSNSSYDSKHTIEDVEIWNCSTNGILVEDYPRDNTFINVKVYYCNQHNVEIHSSDGTLINVQSGWAGLSGFEVPGQDNYFTNCVSWGCGALVVDNSDANGFDIKGTNNLFMGCDASVNDQGGFVLADTNQCILDSCIGRNNGQNMAGAWGFALYNTKSTILNGCLSTDQQVNKTQYYGFSEGGFSDYNLVTGCNFEGNKVGAVYALTGTHTVVRDTLGYSLVYETGNFIYPSASIVVGTNDTYGDAANFTLPNRTTTDFHVTIFVDDIKETANETVTVKIQAVTSAGNVTSLEIPRNTIGTYCLTPNEVYGLLSNGNVDEVLISAGTTENATTATVTVNIWGSTS